MEFRNNVNDNNDVPELVSLVSSNDPELTHLLFHDLTHLMSPSELYDHGWQLSLPPPPPIVHRAIWRMIDALNRNHTLVSVHLSAEFEAKCRSSGLTRTTATATATTITATATAIPPGHNPNGCYASLVEAIFGLPNLEEIVIEQREDPNCKKDEQPLCTGLMIGNHLVKNKATCSQLIRIELDFLRLKTREDVQLIVEGISGHPSLQTIDIRKVHLPSGYSAMVDTSTELLEAILTLSQLQVLKLEKVHVSVAMFLKLLVQLPNLRQLTLIEARLRDEHVVEMTKLLLLPTTATTTANNNNNNDNRTAAGHCHYLKHLNMERNDGLRSVTNNRFCQEGWEALYRLVKHRPKIEIRVCGLYIPPALFFVTRTTATTTTATTIAGPKEGRRRREGRLWNPEFAMQFCVNDESAVRLHLHKEEENRLQHLNNAGLDDILAANNNADDSKFIDIMDKMRNDSIALFYLLRGYPSICNVHRPHNIIL